MIRTNFKGNDWFLVNDAPNFKLGFGVDFKIDTLDQQASLSQRETRRAYSSSVLTVSNFTVTVTGSALNQLVGCLKQLKDQPVLAPFWPAVSFFKDFRAMVITGGLMVGFKRDWSQWALYELGNEPAWLQPIDLVCPVVVGYVDAQKPLKWGNTTIAKWQVRLTEASQFDYALNFMGRAPIDGPLPAGYGTAPKMVPFLQDHRQTEENFTIVINREEMGFTRETSNTFYNHEVMRGQTSQFVLRGLQELADFVYFCQNYAFAGASFWVRSPIQACALLIDGLADDISITVQDATQLIGGEWLTCRVRGLDYFAQVKTVIGNTVTLHQPLGIDLDSGHPLYPLTLSKQIQPTVSIRFPSTVLAVAKLSWMEVKPEETLPAGEVIGSTIGQLPTKVILFHFWRDYGNGAIDHWYFTSFEENVQYAGNEYVSANIDIGDKVTSVNLQDDALDIVSFIENGNPINDEAALTSESILQVEIFVGELKV